MTINRSHPQISVIMAVYNGERDLQTAINSVLAQTFQNFEFIIVDDASTDQTPDILRAAVSGDPRIRVITNEDNTGPYPAANRALQIANAEIIARLDADDISQPDWLEQHLSFFEAHPDHILTSSSYISINDAGEKLGRHTRSLDDFSVRWISRFFTPLAHSGCCFRAKLPNGERVLYETKFPISEDFRLFQKLLQFGKAASLKPALVHYRKRQANITNTRGREQKNIIRQIAQQYLNRDLPDELAELVRPLVDFWYLGSPVSRPLISQHILAMRTMLDFDLQNSPERRRWLMRQSAGVLAEAFVERTKIYKKPMLFAAFLWHARAWLPSLFMRTLAYKEWLPVKMRDDPVPGDE